MNSDSHVATLVLGVTTRSWPDAWWLMVATLLPLHQPHCSLPALPHPLLPVGSLCCASAPGQTRAPPDAPPLSQTHCVPSQTWPRSQPLGLASPWGPPGGGHGGPGYEGCLGGRWPGGHGMSGTRMCWREGWRCRWWWWWPRREGNQGLSHEHHPSWTGWPLPQRC